MTRVRIVTDSSARFSSPGYIDRHNITLIPMTVRCGSYVFEDRPDSNLDTLHNLVEGSQNRIVIQAPSVEQIAETYARLQTETNQIISIHTSSGLCDVVENARIASQRFLGRMDIQVIDSETASMGLGLLVQAVAEANVRGEDLENMIHLARGMLLRMYMVFFLNDLFYLEQKKLVSRSQAILGNMLGIIPFLTMESGRLIPMEKVRSRTRAVEKLIEFVCEFSDIEQLSILQASQQPTQESLSIAERLSVFHPDAAITISCYGPCLSSFVGLDSLGIVVLEADENLK